MANLERARQDYEVSADLSRCGPKAASQVLSQMYQERRKKWQMQQTQEAAKRDEMQNHQPTLQEPEAVLGTTKKSGDRNPDRRPDAMSNLQTQSGGKEPSVGI